MSEKIYRQISANLSNIGVKTTLISISNLTKIQKIFTEIINSRTYSQEFYDIYFKIFQKDYRKVFPDAKSIIVTVYSQQITELYFSYNGADIRTVIPPTYIHKDEEVNIENLLNKILSNYGYCIRNFPLPEKLTTVLSGLGKYGKNNLCYVDGMGSFNTPIIYLSDLPVEEKPLSGMSLAEPCKNCIRCTNNCPTKAITEDSFLINPQKCITYFNENEFELPEWVLMNWQDTIIGCMCCQEVCPMNAKLLKNISECAGFSEAETELILKNTEFKNLPESVKIKLADLSMDKQYEILPRNLQLLVNKKFNK